MAAPSPIPQIGYIVNGLVVQFTSLSLNVTDTTTYKWEFGDGDTSVLENPTHEFGTPNFYSVIFTVDNHEPGQDPVSQTILINLSGALNPNLFNDLPKLIDLYSPSNVVGTVKNHDQKEFFIAKWQNYLQPLVLHPEVSVENMYNTFSWGPLANSLIAKLVVMDIIEATASAFLLTSSSEGASSGTITETGGSTVSSQGGIKSIETGPTKVERYENKDASSNSEKISNLAKAYINLLGTGGPLDQLKSSACQEAQRIEVFLPMCGPLPSLNYGIKIGKRQKSGGYNANPFGITDRMT